MLCGNQTKMVKTKTKEGIKHFELDDGKVKHVFTGRTPRQAALKAATRGFVDIRLRARGKRNKDKSISIHVFNGSVEKVEATTDHAKKHFADKDGMVKKSNVSKVGVERVGGK